MTARPRLFYGWRMVAAGAGLQFLYAGLLLQAFGAYVAVLSEELGWSKTTLAGGAAIQSFEGALIGPVLGWLIDRVGPARVVQAGIVLFGVGMLGLSRVDTVAGFYAALVVVAVGASMCGQLAISVALMHFFRRKRARALSLSGIGLAAGGVAVPLLGWSMATIGWRNTAALSGLAVLLLGWPMARVIRGEPSEVGETVDGEPVVPAVEAIAAPVPTGRDFTARQALRTRAFWLLSGAHGLALLTVTAVNVHAIAHLKQGLGYTLTEASFVITLMTVCQGAGTLLGAAAGDRISKRRVAAACMVAHMVAMLLLAYAAHVSMVVAFAVLHGVAWGLRGPFMQALRADYFGLEAIGMIVGLSMVVVAVGQIGGPMIAGIAADLTGSYRSGFVALGLMAGSGSLMLLSMRKPA